MRTPVTALGGVLSLLFALTPWAPAWAQPEPEAPPPDAPPAPAPEPEPDEPEAPELPPGHPPVQPGEAAPPGHPTLPPGHPPVDAPGQPAPVSELPPVPLAPPAIFPAELEEEEDDVELVGIHDGRVFIRDRDDHFRVYPGGWLRTDFLWSPGAPDVPEAIGGAQLGPQLMVRRVGLEISGEIIERIAFTAGMELGGGRIGDTTYAGDATVRHSMANAHDGRIRPAEVHVSYLFRPWLNLTAGLFNAPFSMENRTRERFVTGMERSLAIRGFVVPNVRELGASLWGEILDDRGLNYEVGVFSGDGPDQPVVDTRPDVMGRIYARPLTTLGKGRFFQLAQIGVSARYGERDQERVFYDYPAIATNQGYVLWQPGYVDIAGRNNHVLPSGSQMAVGGELRLPFEAPTGAVFDIKGEAYYLNNNTREAVEGFIETNTERFGRVEGVGWYATISWWACCTDQLVNGEPGIYRPYTVDLEHDAPTLRGLEIFATASGIVANYNGATRLDSVADAYTPKSNIAVYQFGGGAQYWYGRNFRVAVNYLAYFAPDSGDIRANQVFVPDNLVITDGARGGGHVHHELGTRLAVTF